VVGVVRAVSQSAVEVVLEVGDGRWEAEEVGEADVARDGEAELASSAEGVAGVLDGLGVFEELHEEVVADEVEGEVRRPVGSAEDSKDVRDEAPGRHGGYPEIYPVGTGGGAREGEEAHASPVEGRRAGGLRE